MREFAQLWAREVEQGGWIGRRGGGILRSDSWGLNLVPRIHRSDGFGIPSTHGRGPDPRAGAIAVCDVVVTWSALEPAREGGGDWRRRRVPAGVVRCAASRGRAAAPAAP